MSTCSVAECGNKTIARGLCKEHYSAAYYAQNRDRLRSSAASWWRNVSPEKRETSLAKKRARERARSGTPDGQEQARRRKLAETNRKNGWTAELVDACFRLQDGRCAICTAQMISGNGPHGMHRDHCHEALRPRGLLCRTCNTCLGAYEKHQRPAGLRIEAYEAYLSRSGLPAEGSSKSDPLRNRKRIGLRVPRRSPESSAL